MCAILLFISSFVFVSFFFYIRPAYRHTSLQSRLPVSSSWWATGRCWLRWLLNWNRSNNNTSLHYIDTDTQTHTSPPRFNREQNEQQNSEKIYFSHFNQIKPPPSKSKFLTKTTSSTNHRLKIKFKFKHLR